MVCYDKYVCPDVCKKTYCLRDVTTYRHTIFCGEIKKKYRTKDMKKKLIAVAVAIVAILIIAYFGLGRGLFEKYSYGTEMADLQEHFGVSGEESAIILKNEKIADKALIRDGVCYLKFDTVVDKIGEGFYFDENYNGGTLMFTTADGTYETNLDSTAYGIGGEGYSLPNAACIKNNGLIYISADYVSKFMSLSYNIYDSHVYILTAGGDYDSMEVTSNTQIRTLGGVKSPILREVEKGEKVELIEAMEEWSKVMTSDAFIGYIENKRLKSAGLASYGTPIAPDVSTFDPILMDEKVVLGFNAIAGTAGNDTIYSAIEEAKGMNVIAPTWFSLNNNEGDIRNFGSTSYVETAHGKGLKVWAVADDFNYRNDNGDTSINDYDILSNTAKRRYLERNLVDAAGSLGVDGLNLYFEKLNSDCGPHFAQFLKELSVLTHSAGLTLSVDNYVPFNFNDFYHLDVQGKVVDYVLIMGYDEHYHNSGNIGSVASFDYVCYGLDKTLENVAPEQIINALPLYTIVWKSDGGTVTDSYLTFNNQKEYISKYNIKFDWDESTCQNYAEWQSGSATYYVWFEDSQSITAKLNAMKARNIGGVGVWRLGYGTNDIWNLIGLYKETKTESSAQ
jgi:spore germination protein YaaH